MKQKLQRLCRIANTAMAAVPSLAGRVRLGLLIAIMMPIGAWAQNSTPTYIASIGVAQDGSSGSTGVNDCKSELSGHVIIDRDLNDGAGGDYVYMGYKTTTDPSKAITGIVFRVGKNPPHSITYQGYTFNLVGGDYEANTASLGGWIDLNGRADGVYIYTYVTRASGYGAPLTTMTVNGSSSHSGYITATNTSGNVINLNQEAGGDYLCLHYQRFSATVKSTFHYLTSSGSRTSNSYSKSVKNHQEALTTKPSYPTSVTYDGRTFTFRGWREDNTAGAATVTSPSATYITGDKTYRAVYAADVKLFCDANGGDGAPAAQTAAQYINAGSSSIAKQNVSFTIPNSTCTHSTKCFIMGWSADKAAATAAYQPGGTVSISSNTTLYAVYADHSYSSGICDHCGIPVPGSVAVLSKNGKNVFVGTTLDAVITEAKKCVAADEAVVTLLQNIDLGGNYQSITSGVFTIDLNGFEIKGISSGAVLHLNLSSTNVTLQDSGETGKITGKSAGIYVGNGATLTISSGTISATDSTYGRAVLIRYKSTVNINGGTISGEQYGVCAYNASSSGDRATLNISGGTISGGNSGVMLMTNPTALNISGGTISGEKNGVLTQVSNCTVNISSGTISGGAVGINIWRSTLNISGGTFKGTILFYKGITTDSDIKLTVGEDGTGATFSDGLTVKYYDSHNTPLNIPLNDFLGDGAAYWAGDTMLAPADDATEITGKGDITVKAACTHESGTKQGYANRGDNHTFIWSCCKLEVTEGHTFTDTECVCGAQNHGCMYANGFCTKGCYEPAQLKDGYYQIKNGGNLFWFANYVNTVDRTANAVLTAGIDLENRPWTPIGSTGENSNNYRGHFDGQGHTITGLKVEGGRAGLGFFGEVRTGTVENFTIYGDVVASTDVNYVGGVIGSACGLNSDNDLERNGATIRNITSYVNLTAGSHGIGMVGGFIGYANHETLIENCAWYGTFDAGKYRVDSGAGGLLGRVYDNSAVTIRNCAAYGTIRSAYRSGTYNNQATIYIGGIVSYSSAGAQTVIENTLWAGTMDNKTDLGANAHISAIGTLSSFRSVTHCYALEGSAPYVTTNGTHDTHITTVTDGQLASGEVAYKLGDAWGQAIGTDPYPVLGGAKVYHGYLDCTAAVYTNNANASDEKVHNHVDGFCTVCGHIDAGGGVTIRDGGHTSFAVAEDTEVASITYERTLPNQKWNPLYVPFDIPVSLLAEDYDVARISRVYTATDAGGTVDNMEIETIAEGTLEANTPYFIRAKSEAARTMNLTVTDATLKATATAGVAYTSDAAAYTLVPVYTAMTRTDMTTDIRVITADGVWARMREGSTLNPFRFYLTITPKSSASATPVTVRIITRGEGAGTTGIENPEPETRHSGLIYNLKGQPVEHPVKGQIYIQGGRKVVWGE